MIHTRAQIVATLGPSSMKADILEEMMEHQMDVARFNLSWGNIEEHRKQIKLVRMLEAKVERRIPTIVDLPGPRIQELVGHTFDHENVSPLTTRDISFIAFAAEQHADYIALSFVRNAKDIEECRRVVKEKGGNQRIIAKIERREAVTAIQEIIDVTDAVMIARGDLGNEIPLEEVPFVEDEIITLCKAAGKPVIVATEMLLSMVDHTRPTRAEVTDVAHAIVQGADAVMLSEETAKGKHPIHVVAMMERIVKEAEKHLPNGAIINQL